MQDVDIEGRECLDGQCPDGYLCDFSVGGTGICRSMMVPLDAGRVGFDAGDISLDAGPGRDAATFVDAGSENGCTNPAHIFCEGFESGDLSRWQLHFDGDSTVQTTTYAANLGRYSAEAISAASLERAQIVVDAFQDMSVGDQWVRAYYLFPAGGWQETMIMELRDAMNGQWVRVYVDALSTVSWDSSYEMQTVYVPNIPATLEYERWECIELHVQQGTDAAIELYMGGSLASRWEGIDTARVGVLQNVALGSWHYGPSGSPTVYLDDVVVSTQLIGCL